MQKLEKVNSRLHEMLDDSTKKVSALEKSIQTGEITLRDIQARSHEELLDVFNSQEESRRSLLHSHKDAMAELTDVKAHFVDTLDGTIDNEYGLVIPCDTDKSLSITIAGLEIKLSSSDLVFLEVGDGQVMSAIQPASAALGLESTQYILGDVLLSKVYVGLDFSANTLGIALIA